MIQGPTCDTPQYEQQLRDVGSLADIATGFSIAGAVLVAAGAVVFFTAPRETVISPIATSSGAGVAIAGRF